MKKFVQTPQMQFYSGISGTDSTARITPFPRDVQTGAKLTFADFGTLPTFTADPKVLGYEEIIGFTGLIDNGDDTGTLTGLTRNLLGKFPYYTPTPPGKQHGANSIIVFSNNPEQEGRAAFKENDEQITGSWQFPAPTLPANPARKQDLDNAVINGGGPATVSSLGLVRMSQSPDVSKGTCTITIASPAVITNTAHGLTENDVVAFTTSGTLPTGITAGVLYYVLATGLTADTFEISETAGGTPVTTAGSQTGTQTLIKKTPIALSPNDTRLPTQAENDALVGLSGSAVGSANPFVDKAALSDGNTIDQSQTTQNASVTVGEADATTKHNLLAQSFIAGKTPIKSVALYKIADTGTFTGDVTVSIQADVSGSPSGTPLATVTILNAAWLALSVGEITATFGAEYLAALGSTYWIVIQTTTSDNSNHPNVGSNSAGGYASGSVKFKNTTDGWTAIATIDLYFKVNVDIAGKIVELDSTGALPAVSGANLTGVVTKSFQQTAGNNWNKNDALYTSAADTAKKFEPTGFATNVQTTDSSIGSMPHKSFYIEPGRAFILQGGGDAQIQPLKAGVYTLNAGETDISGSMSATLHTTNGVTCFDAAQLSAHVFIAIYQCANGSNAADGIRVRAGSESGGTITLGTEVTIETTGTANTNGDFRSVAIVALSPTSAIIFYQKDSDSNIYAQVLTISGTTITTNTPVQINGGVNMLASYLSPTQVLFVYATNGASAVSAITINISGTVPSQPGSPNTIVGSSHKREMSLFPIDATRALFSYASGTDSIANALGILTISGSTVTKGTDLAGVGSAQSISNNLGGQAWFIGEKYMLLGALSTTNTVSAYLLDISSGTPVQVFVSANSNATTASAKNGVTVKLRPWTYLIMGGSAYSQIIHFSTPDAEKIGIAKNNTSSGATGDVIQRYTITDNLSGLTTSVPYYVDDNAQPTTASSNVAPVLGISLSTIKMLLN